MKYIFALLLVLVTSPVFAQAQTQTPSSTDIILTEMQSLNAEEKDKLAQAAQDIRAGRSTAQAAKEWVEVGSSIGQGLSATARELGVAVNDFAKSPVGKIAVALIVWKVAGSAIVHLIISMISVGLLFGWYRMFVRTFGEFNDAGKLIRFNIKDSEAGDGWAFMVMLIFPAALFGTFLVSLATM